MIALSIGIVFLIVFIVYVLMMQSINADMTMSASDKFGRGSFSDFKREFQKVEWSYSKAHKYSLFCDGSYPETQLHAGIVMFNGVGMTLNTFDNLRKSIFIYRFLKLNPEKEVRFNDIVKSK